jgi:hypothetical protein
MDVKEKLMHEFAGVDTVAMGFSSTLSTLVDYVISVYTKNGEQEGEFILSNRKARAISKYNIPKSDHRMLLENKSDLISAMITVLMKMQKERKFELFISALDASSILLDVVRRPVSDELDDEKWHSALKAKRQGFVDAEFLIEASTRLLEEMTGMKDADIEAHIEETDFRGGAMERLANKVKGKK